MGRVGYREKRRADLVTEADTLAQETIFKIVKRDFPTHSFLGEEMKGASSDSFLGNADEFCWVVDPLDGTTNFVHSVPFFCTSVALVRGSEPICGVVYNPITEEFFSAEVGKGAFLNGERIKVSEIQKPEESLVAVGFPTDTKSDSPDLIAFLCAVPIAQAIRRTGSTALNLAYVAAGRFDAMWGFSANPWDVAAGILIVKEAGGIITSPQGTEFSLRSPRFITASTPTLLNNWVAIISRESRSEHEA